jgi:hypothetical protein
VGKQKQSISVAQTRCRLQSTQPKEGNTEKSVAAFVTGMNAYSTALFCIRSYGSNHEETGAFRLVP